jgi:aspartokinase
MQSQTSFETARGISAVDAKKGYSLIVVRGLGSGRERLGQALQALENSSLSADFLNLGREQFSFVVLEQDQQAAVDALATLGLEASHHRSKAVIKVSSPNVRDESGLMARICQIVLESGATVYNVGDMHDGVQVVVQSEKSESTCEALRRHIGSVAIL